MHLSTKSKCNFKFTILGFKYNLLSKKYRSYLERTYLHNEECDPSIRKIYRQALGLEINEVEIKNINDLELDKVFINIEE